MGLDVYLAKYQDFELSCELESKYYQGTDANWHSIGKPYSLILGEDKIEVETRNKELAVALGLQEDGSDKRVEFIELPSTKYPDHFFKIGYFRSSYNDGGLDHILRDRIDTDLEEMFCPLDQYKFRPSWDAALVKATLALEKLKTAIAEEGPWRVSSNEVTSGATRVQSTREALVKFLESAEEYKKSPQTGFESYGNLTGWFTPGGEPLKVRAIIPGMQYGRATIYVVFEGESGLKSYVESMEIVVETCEWALANEPEKCYLHWSS